MVKKTCARRTRVKNGGLTRKGNGAMKARLILSLLMSSIMVLMVTLLVT